MAHSHSASGKPRDYAREDATRQTRKMTLRIDFTLADSVDSLRSAGYSLADIVAAGVAAIHAKIQGKAEK